MPTSEHVRTLLRLFFIFIITYRILHLRSMPLMLFAAEREETEDDTEFTLIHLSIRWLCRFHRLVFRGDGVFAMA